jgi:hypothetical protein
MGAGWDPSARLSDALVRIRSLEPDYARAVRNLLAAGDERASSLLVRRVDVARERAAERWQAWRQGRIDVSEVVEAHEWLACVMRRVIATDVARRP